MKRHRRSATALPLLAVTACLAVAPQSAFAETNEDILHTPQRLLSQERKQIDAGRARWLAVLFALCGWRPRWGQKVWQGNSR